MENEVFIPLIIRRVGSRRLLGGCIATRSGNRQPKPKDHGAPRRAAAYRYDEEVSGIAESATMRRSPKDNAKKEPWQREEI